jgi:GNAT superfamily N-acetyltransferase
VNVRPASEVDFDALVRLLIEEEEFLLGRPSKIAVADLRQWLNGVDLASDTWILEDERGMTAFGWAECTGDLGFAVGAVHPRAKGTGLGSRLVELSEARLGELGAARVHQVAFAADTDAPGLLERHGYREVRRFYEMGIDFEGPPPEPSLPEGMTIEPFDSAEGREFYAALDESFQDHWEHHSLGFETWWERRSTAPDFDPTLWFLVRDGEEIAAVARNDPNRNGGGWVGALGVRRPWRGQGLGRALLLHTFGEFHRRGVNRVTLGVDTENATGATRLYESVGMAPEIEQVVYEKAFR